MRSCHGLRDRCRIRWHFLSAGDLQRVASEVVSASFLSLRATTTTTTTKLQHTWLLNLFCGSSTCVRMSYKGWNDLRWTRLVFYFLFFSLFFIYYYYFCICFIKVQTHLKHCEVFFGNILVIFEFISTCFIYSMRQGCSVLLLLLSSCWISLFLFCGNCRPGFTSSLIN